MRDFFKDQFFKAIEKNTIFSRANPQGILTFVSDKLCKISGYSKKELIGQKHSIFRHPDVEEYYIEELLNKLSRKKPYEVIFKNIDKLGKTFYLETLLIPILNKNNELTEIVAFSRDVSNFFKLNEELALNHAKLRELSINLENTVKDHKKEFIQLGKKFEKKLQIALEKNEKDIKIVYEEILRSSLEQMICDIAHQWRQPLNELGIAMFQMKQNLKDEKGFAEIYSQSKSMIKNMSKTIDVFRTLFNNKEAQPYVFIEETLNKTLEIVFETIEKNHVNINIISKGDYEVLAYENGLIRVFLNLIFNSIEALKNKKRKVITIAFLKFGKNYLKIKLKDNAGGIDKKNLDKIFQPYFTTKHPSQGIGVGLYISRQIIESFQGKIKVKNEKDGACFEIFLKLKERME
ncbi:PAS domain-containing sensor histidine kinase [Campylobacter sp. VicNov18]|uniref:butyrate sensor histidiine kinase-like phosphatase BumS n=1 Tax=Campylobacter bilis TaxID=2691918 RepID=UPI00130D6843|nr:butyrate sensor histidiine kinase-like phosphatase BumS [Campylobacter bilis]MPV63950.1 PAS domain S-box protein [Campylobacter hepaticus]MBM0637451.1 PAS domain S-box protein [Campylobacter bilis]MCC8278170.1 PAS domain-containing sensor histidine kinase [Campylobacter bilis]MCC8299674.1 PAS domain-containing sensor histidine kinase [Campylobacter bilis]MCC8301079.1 PAS domain-containing sensor histidine kinase [Campylobacter bilis]